MSFIKRFLTPISASSAKETNSAISKEEEKPVLPLFSQNGTFASHLRIYSDENILSEEEPKKDNSVFEIEEEEEADESLEEVLDQGKPEDSNSSEISFSPKEASISETEKETADSEELPTTVESYFSGKGITLSLPSKKEVIPPVSSLAFSIALNYSQTKPFIRFLRESISKKTFDFVFSLSAFSVQDKAAIISLADRLCEYGLISNLFYNKSNNTLRATASSAGRCVNFINGDFLEFFAEGVTFEVIKKLAESHGCDFEFYHNVNIEKDRERHELDMVFRLGNHIFWSEIKSGKFNPDDYRKLGNLMGVVPDRLILLAADKPDDVSEAISYFYEYYCTNVTTFKNKLISMIEKAFNEEK